MATEIKIKQAGPHFACGGYHFMNAAGVMQKLRPGEVGEIQDGTEDELNLDLVEIVPKKRGRPAKDENATPVE